MKCVYPVLSHFLNSFQSKKYNTEVYSDRHFRQKRLYAKLIFFSRCDGIINNPTGKSIKHNTSSIQQIIQMQYNLHFQKPVIELTVHSVFALFQETDFPYQEHVISLKSTVANSRLTLQKCCTLPEMRCALRDLGHPQVFIFRRQTLRPGFLSAANQSPGKIPIPE